MSNSAGADQSNSSCETGTAPSSVGGDPRLASNVRPQDGSPATPQQTQRPDQGSGGGSRNAEGHSPAQGKNKSSELPGKPSGVVRGADSTAAPEIAGAPSTVPEKPGLISTSGGATLATVVRGAAPRRVKPLPSQFFVLVVVPVWKNVVGIWF